jgi:hypothetical protein
MLDDDEVAIVSDVFCSGPIANEKRVSKLCSARWKRKETGESESDTVGIS